MEHSSTKDKKTGGVMFSQSNSDETTSPQKDKLMRCAVGFAGGSIFYPLQHAKVLIQLGHEPLPLDRGKKFWFFGRETFFLPNGFSYVKYIYRNYGSFTGLYAGFASWGVGTVVGTMASLHAADAIDRSYPTRDEDLPDPEHDSEEVLLMKLLKRTSKDAAAKMVGLICARPFQVIMIRKIAQIVGGEKEYEGIVPQLIGELCVVYTAATAMHLFERIIKKQFPEESGSEAKGDSSQGAEQSAVQTLQRAASVALPYVVNAVFYPLQLVSTVMAVNGTSLAAGREPHIPIFFSWGDCYTYLKIRKQLKRGAGLFFRAYTGPTAYMSGKMYPVLKYKDYRL